MTELRQAGGVNTIAIRGPDQRYKETHSKIFVHKVLFIVNGLKKKRIHTKSNQQERRSTRMLVVRLPGVRDWGHTEIKQTDSFLVALQG